MRALQTLLLPLALLMFQAPAFADPDKDESGHGKRGHGYDRREYRDDHGHGNRHGRDRREYKEEYFDGNCKVERKYEKNGEYKEERKCSGPRHGYREQPRRGYYEQPPVYVPAPPAMYEEPGAVIRGTIRIP